MVGLGPDCVEECPVGYYTFTDGGGHAWCIECESNCDSCSDDTTCTECAPGFYLLDDDCVEYCPEGYFEDWRGGVAECSECYSRFGDLDCLACEGP